MCDPHKAAANHGEGMRIIKAGVIGITTAAMLVASTPARAQEHVVDLLTLRQTITDKTAARAADQAAVKAVLERQATRDLANRLGLDLRAADRALATLSHEELAQLAASARAADTELAGGQRTITISVTVLLLLLILIVLIAD
jgi:hypothetical protein